ncbi:MAG TPA: hypothetical protein VMZ00_06025 [Sporichthya sp.]|nr:hypothetical protein [Sporichthya sp.]
MFRKQDRKEDRLVRSIRKRRAVSALDRVLNWPGFFGLKAQLRTFPDSDYLDLQKQALGAGAVVAQWSDNHPLADALLAASAVLPLAPAHLWLSEEPEARWIRAPLGDVVKALSFAVGSMSGSVVLLTEDGLRVDDALSEEVSARQADPRPGCALVIDIEVDGSGQRSFTTALHGPWEPAVVEALAP